MRRLISILIILILGVLFAVIAFVLLSPTQGIDRPIRMKEDLLDAPVIVEGYPTGESRYAIGPDGSTAEWYLSFEVSRVFKGKLRSEPIEVLQNNYYPLETTRPQDASYILFLDVYEKSDPVVYSYESHWCLYRSDETNTTPVYDMYSSIRSWLNFLEVDGSPSSLSDWLATHING